MNLSPRSELGKTAASTQTFAAPPPVTGAGGQLFSSLGEPFQQATSGDFPKTRTQRQLGSLVREQCLGPLDDQEAIPQFDQSMELLDASHDVDAIPCSNALW